MAKYFMRTTLFVMGSFAATVPVSADWRSEIGTFAVGLLGGENEADRLRRYDCLDTLLTERLGVPVELYPAADYAGVMQGLLAGQLHMAGLGASAYAGIHLQDETAVDPFVTVAQLDGSLGYYAVVLVRASSDMETIEDLAGRSLAFADPNSMSGYLVPKAELEAQGFPESFFSRTGFGGGHEQGVIAVLNGQYDAAATWISGQGEREQGFSRGNLRRMVDNGLLDMNDIRIVWRSSLIPNGPIVKRADLPQEAKDIVAETYATMHETDPACFAAVTGGDALRFEPIGHDFYQGAVEMRRNELASSR